MKEIKKLKSYLKLPLWALSLAFFVATTCDAQVSLLSLQDRDATYRSVLKKASKDRVPVLAILYSPTYPVSGPNNFSEANEIIRSAKVHPIVIDWASSPDQKPQRYFTEIDNPGWMLIHPDEIIIGVSKTITNDNELKAFLDQNLALCSEIEEVIQSENPDKLDRLLKLARLSARTYDQFYTSEVIDDFLGGINLKRIKSQYYKEVLGLAMNGPYSKQLNKLINQSQERAIMLAGLDTVLNIQTAYIQYDLKQKGLLDPYFIWQRYEKELGVDADSLYRIFAIQYFSTPPVEDEMLYNEAFDFVNFYPRAPWNVQKQLFRILIPATSKEEDLNLLLDLISFQIFREKTYDKLDYQATILYKLGQKERALEMVDEINRLALEQGIRYKSMLYTMTSDK